LQKYKLKQKQSKKKAFRTEIKGKEQAQCKHSASTTRASATVQAQFD
jgi:hypothetical protein